MTRRVASKMIPPTWYRKPTKTNLTSPNEAIMTPRTMTATLVRTLRLTEAIPIAQVASKTATGVVACELVAAANAENGTHLEHLDEGDV